MFLRTSPGSLLLTALEKYGHLDEKTGIRFAYVKADLKNPGPALREAGLQGRILVIHATNLLDAVPTNFLAQYEGIPYQVVSQAYVPSSAIESLAKKYTAQNITTMDLSNGLGRIHAHGAWRIFQHLPTSL